MLASLLSALFPVTRAEKPEEFESIFRLRYDVYVRELGKRNLSDVVRVDKKIADPEDRRHKSAVFYTGSSDRPSATIRIDLYSPREMPEEIKRRYGVHSLPGIDDLSTSEISRLIVAPSARGSFIAMSLAIACYRYGVTERGTQIGFAYAAPGLIRGYSKFGMRRYPAQLVETADGLRVPLVAVWSDKSFLRQSRSPLAALVSGAFGPGRHAAGNVCALSSLLESQSDSKAGHAGTKAELEALFTNQNQVFKNVPRRAIDLLLRKASILVVERDQLLLRAGLVDRELFLLLAGRLVVKRGNVVMEELSVGEPVGELALFSNDGARTADVWTVERSKLLFIGRRFVDVLLAEDPESAAALLRNFASIMAARMGKAISLLENTSK